MSVSVFVIDVIAIIIVLILAIASTLSLWKRRDHSTILFSIISYLNLLAHIEVSSTLRYLLLEGDLPLVTLLFKHTLQRELFFIFSGIKSLCWVGVAALLIQRVIKHENL